MKFRIKNGQKYAFLAALFSAVIYFALIGVFLKTEEKTVLKNESRIPYDNVTGELLVYASCEELSQYGAVYADFDMKTITVFLFPDEKTAKNYGLSYTRQIEYTKQTQIELIGRMGGIVIDKETCYNVEGGGKERIFGNRVIELSQQSEEIKEHIAYAFLSELLSYGMSKQDFLYIAENCNTDLSYADFYRYFDLVCSFKNNISVRVVL